MARLRWHLRSLGGWCPGRSTDAQSKVNAVALRDFTEAEAVRFAELALRKTYEVRFIEWMPPDADQR